MSENIFLEIFIGICFIVIVVVLFFDKLDYVTFSLAIIIIAGIVSSFFIEEVRHIEFYVDAINWEVIFFLIGMFAIVEVLNEKKIFHELARRIVKRYRHNIRKLFYFLCITSTLVASVLEDLSVAIIFGPIIVITCLELKINPTPFLLGMTICINLGSMLLPFGSAESIIIVNALDLDIVWFLQYFGVFFVVSTLLTLFLLDKFVLKKYLQKEWNGYCEDESAVHRVNLLEQTDQNRIENVDQEHLFYHDVHSDDHSISDFEVDKKTFNINMFGLLIFLVLLITVPTLYLASLISALMFIFINPVEDSHGKKRPSISHFFKRVDYKLIYFFICLFILVKLMDIAGSLVIIEQLVMSVSQDNLFILCVVVLLISSLLSGFMDNAPVTVIFIPIVILLLSDIGYDYPPLIFAFVLGVNCGGNFLPQGSACDMMTLEIAKQNCVYDLSYKKLMKVGASFALLHIAIGIVYLAFFIYVIPL